MNMKIGVVGLGYVGIVTAAVLSDRGNEVVGIDVDQNRVDKLKSLKPPIHEPGLDEMLERNADRLSFSSDYSNIKGCDAVFVSVQTPNKGGHVDTSFVNDAVSRIKQANAAAVMIIKSTVPPGTTRAIAESTGMKVAFNPEFTKEGTAIEDTLRQDRVVIGCDDKELQDFVWGIWSFAGSQAIKTTYENAEMIKYASNTFLAVKISFINEMSNIAERIRGCDIDVVARGMGLDPRISPHFLKAGLGWGGSCLPKDSQALEAFAEEHGEQMLVLKAAMDANDKRIPRIIKIVDSFAKGGRIKRIGVLGLSFKAGTDDLRESQGLKLMNALASAGYEAVGFDPRVRQLANASLCGSKEECIESSDAVIIATAEEEFKDMETLLGDRFVVDVHRILKKGSLRNLVQLGIGENK